MPSDLALQGPHVAPQALGFSSVVCDERLQVELSLLSVQHDVIGQCQFLRLGGGDRRLQRENCRRRGTNKKRGNVRIILLDKTTRYTKLQGILLI